MWPIMEKCQLSLAHPDPPRGSADAVAVHLHVVDPPAVLGVALGHGLHSRLNAAGADLGNLRI